MDAEVERVTAQAVPVSAAPPVPVSGDGVLH